MKPFGFLALLVALPALANAQFQGFGARGRGGQRVGRQRGGERGGAAGGGGRPQQGGRPEGLAPGESSVGLNPDNFDIDKDMAPVLVAQTMGDAVRAAVSPFASDASLVIRITVLMANSFFDAIAPYTETAVGIYSKLGRRPLHEHTVRNKNIAVFYCSLRVLGNAIPDQALRFVENLEKLGLDPEDTHESKHDPIGIGNICGRSINEVRDHDGQNSKGDIGAKSRYNNKPYYDYTGYKPVNTYDNVVDPRRWQPAVTDLNGVYKIQKFVTPQHGFTQAYSYKDVNQFVSKPHGRLLEGPNGKELYKKTTDEVIAISAALTDAQKMAAEFFDDKLLSFGFAFFGTVEVQNLTYNELVYYELATNVAAFDSTIAIWKEKARWDAVRPFTAIPYLYGDNFITAYGGKGQGTVNDIPASSWDSYMPVADHPEYPSLTASVCASFAEASRNFLGTDATGLEPVPFEAGNSRREFGITPRKNVTINMDTWTEFELTCGSSRLWGGVHFVDAVEEGNRIGNEIGKIASDFVRRHIDPHAPLDGPVIGPNARGGRRAPAAPQALPLTVTPVPSLPVIETTGPAVVHGLVPLAHSPQYPAPYHYPTIPAAVYSHGAAYQYHLGKK